MNFGFVFLDSVKLHPNLIPQELFGMNGNLVITILILTATSQLKAQSDCVGIYPKDLSKMSNSELGKAFLKLNKPDNTDCKKFGSDLHRIMNALGVRLGKEGTTIKKLKSVMGIPNSYQDKLQVVKLKEGEELWIYHWRGWHDWLYFVVQDKKVKRADWWMAYE